MAKFAPGQTFTFTETPPQVPGTGIMSKGDKGTVVALMVNPSSQPGYRVKVKGGSTVFSQEMLDRIAEGASPVYEAVKAEVRRQMLVQRLSRPVQRRPETAEPVRARELNIPRVGTARAEMLQWRKSSRAMIGTAPGKWTRKDYPGPVLTAFQIQKQGGQFVVTANFSGNAAIIVKRVSSVVSGYFEAQKFFDANFVQAGQEAVRESGEFTSVRFKGNRRDVIKAAQELQRHAVQAGRRDTRRSGSRILFADGADEATLDEWVDKVYNGFPEGEYPMATYEKK